jgi:class 3 adenylate cyclase
VLGGFFCFFPLKELDSPERLPIELIFKHWKLVGPNQKAFPAILPIDERSAKIHVHSAIRSPELEKELRKFRKTYFSRVKSLVAELADKARLPGELFGKVFKVGEFSARLCSLSPVSGSVGLLLGKPESLDKSLRQYMVQAYFLIISILWGMALIKVMVFRKLPPVNLRFRIMAWFLAFAAFPVGLTIGAWSSLLQDFARFRVKELQSALFTASQNIEAGLTDIDNRFLKASRQCLGQSEVVAMLEQLPEIPETEKDFFSLLQKKFNDENISISGTMVIMQGGWCFSDFDKTVTKRMRNTLNTGIASLLEKYLRENNPVLYAKMQVPEEHADKKLLSMGSLFAVNTYRNLGALPRFFDRVTDLRIDRRDYLQFIYQHFSKGEPLALIIVLWDWNHEFRELITSLLQKETLRFRKNWGNVPDIAVFKSTSAGNRMLAKVGDLNSLLPLSDFPAAGFKALSDKDSASVIIPSTRIESIKFVARVTTSNIALIVADEKVFIVLSVIATLFMMQLGATVVSGWIAGPVNKLSKALGLLSQGQTSRPEISNRQDEITTAQTALVKMFAWIEERERLLPFVSPKALDAVAGGNVFKAGAGVMQEVTILVSDIRSFTSLTENYPANQVFAMINAHLKEMASVIQGHSGVIDRFVGDAVWAVFFDPHPQGGKSALKAAAAMVRAHQRIQDKRRARGEFSYQIGVGLVRGNILAGVLGEASVRLDFTVIGDMLKQAEKLESLSRHSTGSGIIFSGNLSDCADELGIDYQPLMTDEDVLEVANLDV